MTHIGKPYPRIEDARLLRGAGCFTADVSSEAPVHAVVVRSPHGHARIDKISVDNALSAPGVIGVCTNNDLVADGVETLPCWTRTPPFNLLNADGSEMPEVDQWVLCKDKVRHVGDPVAFVVAETPAQALDAAECVEVAYT